MKWSPLGVSTPSPLGQPCGSVRSEMCCFCTTTEIALVRVTRGLADARPRSVLQLSSSPIPLWCQMSMMTPILSPSLYFSALFLDLLNSMTEHSCGLQTPSQTSLLLSFADFFPLKWRCSLKQSLSLFPSCCPSFPHCLPWDYHLMLLIYALYSQTPPTHLHI